MKSDQKLRDSMDDERIERKTEKVPDEMQPMGEEKDNIDNLGSVMIYHLSSLHPQFQASKHLL